MYKFVRTFKKPQKVIDNAPKSSIEDNAILEVTPTNQTNLISKTSSSFNANKPLISNDVIENANNTETVRAELSSENVNRIYESLSELDVGGKQSLEARSQSLNNQRKSTAQNLPPNYVLNRSTSSSAFISSSNTSISSTESLSDQTKRFRNLELLKDNYTKSKTQQAKEEFLNELNQFIAEPSSNKNKSSKKNVRKNRRPIYPVRNIELKFKIDDPQSQGKHFISFLNRLPQLNRRSRNNKLEKMVRESSKPAKNVSFRASSLISQKPEQSYYLAANKQQESHRVYRSLSPSSNLESYATAISQQPSNLKTFTTQAAEKPKNVYFAQAIGQGRVTKRKHVNNIRSPLSNLINERSNNNDERIYEIHTSPIRKDMKKQQARNQVSSPCYSAGLKVTGLNRDLNSILNLASNESTRIRTTNSTIRPRETDINRSLSVNYLYNKRRSDLRKFQKDYEQIYYKNHIGFTTEDIDDIYMPSHLDNFESKLKASLDISDSSQQEEIKNRKKFLCNMTKKRNHNQPKNLRNDEVLPKFTISVQRPNGQQQQQQYRNAQFNSKSYLDEANRKLKSNHKSKDYYYNLNNKLKSSVASVMKATLNLEKSSELRQMKQINRNLSLHELYDIRRGQIRTNLANKKNAAYTSDDIDSVYMPWMMENYGRKLAIEALKRRSNMNQNHMQTATSAVFQSRQRQYQIHNSKRHKSPYISQYYAQSKPNVQSNMSRNDLWLIDKEIRKMLKKSKNSSEVNANDTEVSISDSETSSDDTRPIVPEKINKPDISLKNKILKTINKSLLSSELTGINLTMLKLNDHVRKSLKRVEKIALERDLEYDLIRSFSCNHLNDLRREDIKYSNMKRTSRSRKFKSYTTDDVTDLYMPKILETYKLKLAVERENGLSLEEGLSSGTTTAQTPLYNAQSPLGYNHGARSDQIISSAIASNFESSALQHYSITSPPRIQVKSPMSPNTFKNNPNNLFQEIMQERLNEIDQRMAFEISSAKKGSRGRALKRIDSIENISEEEETTTYDEDRCSTDQDQDDSIDMCSASSSDDLNMNDEEMRLFDINTNHRSFPKQNMLFEEEKHDLKSTSNQPKMNTTTLQNPGSLISDFYISNMNYAMRYSVEYVQQVAKDLRSRRNRQDSMNNANQYTTRHLFTKPESSRGGSLKSGRSCSVDRLYAVRREHIRYANGADEYFGARNISFTTDDIQDIYMPSAIDNYKRKIAVELERRRRFEQDRVLSPSDSLSHTPKIDFSVEITKQAPIVLDDLDIFIIKKAKSSVESERILAENLKLRIDEPNIYQSTSRLKEKVYDGIPLVSKPRIKFPITHTDYKEKKFIEPSVELEDSVHIEQANIRVQRDGFGQYAMINKVDMQIMDNEVIPSSSSDSESMSVSPVDSLNNLAMDSFDASNVKRLKKSTVPYGYELNSVDVNQVSITQSVKVQKAKGTLIQDNLNYINVNSVPLSADFTSSIEIDRANFNVERNQGLTSKINVVYPPSTGIDITENIPVERANMNVERGDGFNSNVNVSEPPQTIIDATQNIRTDRANLNIEQGIDALRSKVNVSHPPQASLRTDRANLNIEQGIDALCSKANVSHPPQASLRTDRANFNIERGIDALKSPVNVSYPPQTSIQTDRATLNIEQSSGSHSSKVNVTYPPQSALGTDHANLYLERGIDDLKPPVNIVYPPYVEFNSTDQVARANFKYEPNLKLQVNDNYRVDVNIHTRNKMEEETNVSVRHLNESQTIDSHDLITARVNTVQSFNLAQERSSPETVQFSKYLPPEHAVTCEAACRESTSELTSTLVNKEQIRTLNAPTITQDKFSLQEATEMIPSKVSLHEAEYIIEEFAHKPIDSEITYSYDQVDILRHKNLATDKLNHQTVQQTSFTRPNVTKVETLAKADIRSETTSEDLCLQDISTTVSQSRLKTKTEPIKIMSAATMRQNEMFEDTKPMPESAKSFETLESKIENRNLAFIKQPLHVTVPVNIFQANQNEYQEFEAKQFDPELTQTEKTVLKNEEECVEKLTSKSKIKSLSLAQIDDLSLSDAESLMNQSFEKEQLTESNQLLVLENNVNKSSTNILNLANIPSVEAESPEQTTEIASNMEQHTAKSSSEGFYLNSKASVADIASLNAPAVLMSSFEEGEIEEIEFKTDMDPLNASEPSMHKKTELIKPAIAKKPMIISQGLQNMSSVTLERTDSLTNTTVDGIETQTITRQQSINWNQGTATTVQNLAMAEYSTIELLNAIEYEPEDDDKNKATVTVEDQALIAAELNKTEEICDAESLDTFNSEETTKPMSTVDVNFEDRISLISTMELAADHGDLNVSVVKRFNRPVEENLSNEKSDEFFSFESDVVTMEVFAKETANELEAMNVLKFNPVEMARAEISFNSVISDEELDELEQDELKPLNPTTTTTSQTTQSAHKYHLDIFNKPIEANVDHETTTSLHVDLDEQQQTQVNIEHEIQASQEEQTTIRIQILNAPRGFAIEEFTRDNVESLPTEHRVESQLESTESVDECQLKVGIELQNNLNMASISANTENDNEKENNIDLNRTPPAETANVSGNNLQLVSIGDVRKSSLPSHFGLAIITETNNMSDECNNLNIDTNSMIKPSIGHHKSQLISPSTPDLNIIHLKKLVRNSAVPMFFKYEQCDRFVPIVINMEQGSPVNTESPVDKQLVESVQTCVMVRPNIERIDDSQADETSSIDNLIITANSSREDILENKPDKNMLLWLNYPHLRSHITEEETTGIDEKLDYLYEKIKASTSTTDLSSDTNLVQIEKVLSLFISNQEKIETDYELISTFDRTRPEVQELVMRKPFEHDGQKNVIITPEPCKLGSANCNTTSFTEDDQIDYNDYIKIEQLTKNAADHYDSIEQLSKISEDDNAHIHTSSKVVFNLPSIGKLAQLDETTTEFYDPVVDENVCEETVELICLEKIHKIVDEATKTPVLNAPANVKLDHSFEKIWDIDPRNDMLSIIQEVPLIKEKNQVNEAVTKDQPIEWQTIKEENIESNLVETVYNIDLNNIDSIRQQINFYNDDFDADDTKHSEQLESFTCTHEMNKCVNNESFGYMNACEKFSQRMYEDTVNLNNTDDDLGSFIEQIEKYELISDTSGRLDNISECQTEFFNPETDQLEKANITTEVTVQSEFLIEKEKLNRLVEQIELPKWEEADDMTSRDFDDQLENLESMFTDNKITSGILEINQPATYATLNESINDADFSIASEISSNSSKIHLIESVEIVTHHNNEDEQIHLVEEPTGHPIHIHKVDINRLQIREKKNKPHFEESQNRFRVDFKQEEVCDLRDFEANTQSELTDGKNIDVVTDKVFAKKFVDQVFKLNNSKFTSMSCSNDNLNNDEDRTELDESFTKYDTMNFNRLSGKSSMEILESLHNLKDIGKHLTDSVFQGKSSHKANNDKLANDLFEINEFLMNERSSAIDATDTYQKIDDDDQDSLKDGDFDENLHVSVEHDDIQIPVSQMNDNDTNNFNDTFGMQVSAREFMISPVTSITMITKDNDDNKSKDLDTIEILTEIIRHQNKPTNPEHLDLISDINFNLDDEKKSLRTPPTEPTSQKVTALNDSKTVTDSLKEYLDNLNNAVVNAVNLKTNSDQEEDEISIRETVTVQQKADEIFKHETNEVSTVVNNEHAEDLLDTSCDSISSASFSSISKKFSKKPKRKQPISGTSIQKVVPNLPDIQNFDNTVDIIDSVVIDHVSEDDKSITSDEVTYERWTEETKLIKTDVLDKHGNVIDEVYQSTTAPELIGNIVREKLVERHDHHSKRIAQDVLKRVKIKSANEKQKDHIESDLIATKSKKQKSNRTYYIQHQQIISPAETNSGSSSSGNSSALSLNNSSISSSSSSATSNYSAVISKRQALPRYHLTPLIFSSRSKCLSKLLEMDTDSTSCELTINPDLPTNEIINMTNNKRFVVQNHFRIANRNKVAQRDDFDLSTDLDDNTECTRSICFTSTNFPPHSNNFAALSNDSLNSLLTSSSFLATNQLVLHEISKNDTLNLKDSELGAKQTYKVQMEFQSLPEPIEIKSNSFLFTEKQEEKLTYMSDENELQTVDMDQDKTTSDSLESMGRFKRPTKSEMRLLLDQANKQPNDATEEDINEDDRTELSARNDPLKFFMPSSTQDITNTANPLRKNFDMTDTSDTEDFFRNQSKTFEKRSLPLRRESFELAQRSDSALKRLSISASLKQKQDNSSMLQTSASDNSKQNISKRLLSEIKPFDDRLNQTTESNEPSTDDKELFDTKKKSQLITNDIESDSSTDSSLLKRNLEIIRKKSTEKHNTSNISGSCSNESILNESEHVFATTTFLKPKTLAHPDDLKPPSKIKFVKKLNKQAKTASEILSASQAPSPYQLIRGPDIIETIETTTSMSFIMNKNVNLTYEEKRIPAPTVFANHRQSPQTEHTPNMDINSTPIPITIQSRSKSESRLNERPFNRTSFIDVDNHLYSPSPIELNSSNEYSNYHKSSPKASSPKHNSYHKHNTNEIITYVNMPEASADETVESIIAPPNHFYSNFSKSVSNLHDTSSLNHQLKLDSWTKWPEYAVDQDTDISIHSAVHGHDEWIKHDYENVNNHILPQTNRRHRKLTNSRPHINQTVIVSHPVNTRQTGLSSVSATTTNIEQQTAATRMSSGYFSGDEFRSYYKCNDINSIINNSMNQSQQHRTQSNQFDINKFLNNNNTHKKLRNDAFDDFNTMYRKIGLEDEELYDRANACDRQLYGQVNIHINKELDVNKVYELIEDVRPENVHHVQQQNVTNMCRFRPNTNNYENAFEKPLLKSTTYKSAYNLNQIPADNLPQLNTHRDDASVFNRRQRSNSMSSLYQNDSFIQNLVVPSPTTADYLRNRTRENFNIVQNPCTMNKGPKSDEFELSQILYDDMAYRQLRKDSDAFKLSQMKSILNSCNSNTLTNITTLPSSASTCSITHNNETSSNISNYSSVKTIKKIKQKDASNKTYKQSLINATNSYSHETPYRYDNEKLNVVSPYSSFQ